MSLLSTVVEKVFGTMERTLQVNGSTVGAVASGRVKQRLNVALRHKTWKKFFNFMRVELQLRFGKTNPSGHAYEWEIDTTNICQLKCPLCHTGLGTIQRDKGVMNFDVYKKTIDEIKDYCLWLSLYSWGEPFLNKDIDEFIKYAHDANIATIISSNLNKPLDADMAERLVKSGLDSMIVSLDGTTQDVYEVYRINGHLAPVLANLKLISETRERLGSQTPYIEWQFIVMRQNEHQMDEARELAKSLGVDDIVFKKVDFPHGEDDDEVAKKWVPVHSEGFTRDNPLEKPYEEGGVRCWRLWRSGVVNWDGGYAPCCYLTDAADDFGNVKDTSIKSIWNGANYQTARKLFKDDYTPDRYVGCINCNVYTESKAGKKRGAVQLLQVNGHRPDEQVDVGARAEEEDSSKVGKL